MSVKWPEPDPKVEAYWIESYIRNARVWVEGALKRIRELDDD